MTIEVEARGEVGSSTKHAGAATASEGDGDDDKEEEDEDTHNSIELGGESSVPCFCLLDGFFNDPESGEKSRVTIPITKLPATLGRSHDSDDPHFFGLGKKKALSRKQCRIVYRDAQGGKVQWDAVKQHLVYIDPTATATATATGDPTTSADDGHATLAPSPKNQRLPLNGFFVVENLGKNRILVNQGRVEQGNAAVLQSGSSLRVSSYTLYFLRPLDAKPTQHIVTQLQQQLLLPVSTNKRKATPDAPLSSTKRSKVSQQHFDSLPVETLLDQMNEAIDNSLWERRHQLIGASIALHAIKEAANDPTIQTVALNGGVSRSEIMAWVEQSPKYSNWVSQMLLKMEPRSYQAAITKCLLKAGFSRTSSSGRYIKWYLPKDTTIVVPNVTTSENATATTTTNNNNNNRNKPISKQKTQDRQHQQDKGREGLQHRHDNENGEEQDEDDEEVDEEAYDNEEDEKSGADNDRDDDNDQEQDDQDHDEQEMQDDDNDHQSGTEEANEERDHRPLRDVDLGEDDDEEKSSSSELDRTRPYTSSAHKHHISNDNDDEDDDDEEEEEEEEEEEKEGREDEQDNYV